MARVLVGWRLRRTSRPDTEKLFLRERKAITSLAREVDPDIGRRQVLIKRLRGLEDSSRNWSIFMTVEHLRIVNQETTGLMSALLKGDQPIRAVSTAAVKPLPDVTVAVIDTFEKVCDEFESTVASVSDLHTRLRWPHPWFGPLDAAQWHFFTAFHMTLHLRQMQLILRSLPLPI
jgi:hypothetical protein